MKTRGFTLMEVLISMFIMSMLTILVSTTVRTAVQNKKKLEARMASENLLYDTLRVIRLDVERAFHYQDVFYEMEMMAMQQAQQQSQGQGGQGRQPGQPGQRAQPGAPGQGGMMGGQPMPPPPPKLTQFLGESKSMHFTTLNHQRTRYGAQESDQMEVGYFVDSCQRRKGKGTTTCLWRRASTQIDDRVDEGGSRTVVAEAVQKFKLSYRSKQENDPWVDQWRSDPRGRPDHQNRFPHLVKVELEIGEKDNPDLRPMAMTMVTRVMFPNNEPMMTPQGQPGMGQQPGMSQQPGGGRPGMGGQRPGAGRPGMGRPGGR